MNQTPRTLVVGDVHGCHHELLALLDKFNWDPTTDKVILAGDLVDRGPFSREVVQWARAENQKNPEGVQCVIGNHDDKHVRWWKHLVKKKNHPNYTIPMKPFTTEKLFVFNSLEDEDLAWLEGLPSLLVTDQGWVVVHAGLMPNLTLQEQDRSQVPHVRYLDKETLSTVSVDETTFQPPDGSVLWTEAYTGIESVAYGHHVHSLDVPSIVERPNGAFLVGIDTGCCFGGRLTGFVVPEPGEKPTKNHFIQVQAEKVWRKSFLHPVSERSDRQEGEP